MSDTKQAAGLAVLGGEQAVTSAEGDLFTWPIVTAEHEQAVLEVLRSGRMSGWDVTKRFEAAYAEALGRTYGLACNTGTAALHCAMYGLGIGVADEVIVPSLTYWATCLQVYSLGGTVVFAEVDPQTVCLDAKDIEGRITERTKAIIVVHYAGMPAAMDAILAVAGKYDLKVLEDCSHAHGALYKGKEVGTFGDAAGFSLMSGKSFAIGEGGILFTDDQRVYERAMLFGHYARHDTIELEDLKQFAGLPCGGYKYRMHQLSSAMGLVQLKKYPQQMAEIDTAMNYFCDLLEETPGIYPIRPARGSRTTKGGWYCPLARYVSKELGGLSLGRFAEGVQAEGSVCDVGCNLPLHLHPVFSEMDVYGHGRPTRVANLSGSAGVSQPAGSLPVTESLPGRTCRIPWFKRYRPELIEEHANAYKKVAANYDALLAGDTGQTDPGWYSTFRPRT